MSSSLPSLLTRIGMRLGDLFVRIGRKEGLTAPMYRVLAALAEESRPLRLVELSARTSTDRSTLSRLLTDMHEGGLISRRRPVDDQRSLQVELTTSGRELLERFTPIAAHCEVVATGELSREDADALKATLSSLYDNLDRIEAEIESGEIQKLIKPKPEQPVNERSSRKRGPKAKSHAQ